MYEDKNVLFITSFNFSLYTNNRYIKIFYMIVVLLSEIDLTYRNKLIRRRSFGIISKNCFS